MVESVGGGVAFSALALLLAAACDDEPEHATSRTRKTVTEAPPPEWEYHPEYDRVGGPAEIVLVSEQELADRRADREAKAVHRASPAGWRERILPAVTADTLIVIARKLEDRGAKYGEHTHAALVEVVEHLAGPAPTASVLEVVQPGHQGVPLSCGGLHWSTGMTAALLLKAPGINGSRRILAANGTPGWAVKTAANTFESYGAIVDLPTLQSLGVGP